MIVDTPFATGNADDAVDGEMVVRIFVEEQILAAFGGRPRLGSMLKARILNEALPIISCFFSCELPYSAIRTTWPAVPE